MPTTSTSPRTAVSHGPRNGLRQNRGRNGPGGGCSTATPTTRCSRVGLPSLVTSSVTSPVISPGPRTTGPPPTRPRRPAGPPRRRRAPGRARPGDQPARAAARVQGGAGAAVQHAAVGRPAGAEPPVQLGVEVGEVVAGVAQPPAGIPGGGQPGEQRPAVDLGAPVGPPHREAPGGAQRGQLPAVRRGGGPHLADGHVHSCPARPGGRGEGPGCRCPRPARSGTGTPAMPPRTAGAVRGRLTWCGR